MSFDMQERNHGQTRVSTSRFDNKARDHCGTTVYKEISKTQLKTTVGSFCHENYFLYGNDVFFLQILARMNTARYMYGTRLTFTVQKNLFFLGIVLGSHLRAYQVPRRNNCHVLHQKAVFIKQRNY